MTRRLFPFAALAACASLALAAIPARSPALSSYQTSAEVAAAMRSLDQGQYVRPREVADKILRTDQQSFEAWFLLGSVYLHGDANLPRARYCLTRARELVERRWKPPIPSTGPWRIHDRILDQLISVASLTDQYQWELDLIAEHDRLYDPPQAYLAGWALMKLGRLDEARKRMMTAMSSKSEDAETEALNTLGAIADEQGQREEARKWFTKLTDEVEQRKWTPRPTYLVNRAEEEWSLLRFDQAERSMLTAASLGNEGSSSNPWESLAMLYAGSGRIPEAIAAIRNMHQWARSTDPVLWEQKWNEHEQTTAVVLMAAGYDDAALAIVRRLPDRPDRRGTSSAHTDEGEIELLHLYQEALKARKEHLREEMSFAAPLDWLRMAWERAGIERDLWTTHSRANALIMEHHRLNWAVIPYGSDTNTSEWMRSSFRDIVGAGPWEDEIRRRLEHKGETAALERPYLLSLLGESEWADGNYSAALKDLQTAEAGLPSAESLLRARVSALIGNTGEKLGHPNEARARYRRALDSDSRVFRMLDIELPVSIESSGDPAARAAASMLGHSPRFRSGRGFRVTIGTNKQSIFGRLEAEDGTVFCRVVTPNHGTTADIARTFVRVFHNKAFGAKIDLSQVDIQSLDGSNQQAGSDHRILEELMGERQPQ
jgi:tetratricopeptide (TPR) repeat protein